jgi:hypothetical protein
MNRVDSDESYQSDIDENNADRSIDSEIPPMNQTRKGGRMFSQLDPDAM